MLNSTTYLANGEKIIRDKEGGHSAKHLHTYPPVTLPLHNESSTVGETYGNAITFQGNKDSGQNGRKSFLLG